MTDTNSILEKLVRQALKKDLKTKTEFEAFKRKFAKQNKTKMLSSSTILKVYRKLIKDKKIKPNSTFERLLRLKKVRTISGVTPLAVFTKPFPCPGECLYCPIQKGMPKSYLDDEPAVMRAIDAGFSAKRQVANRIRALDLIGHPTDKIELIVMGGTFSALPKSYRVDFMMDCLATCNESKTQNSKLKTQSYNLKLKTLRHEQIANEEASHRLVGVTFETRPDFVDEKEVKFLRKLGGTRIELGVQSVYDDVLKKVRRGHGVKTTIRATRLLKNAGFKICYHLMPNLPGSSLKRDLGMFREVFTHPDFCPDMVKIYPCMTVYQAPLYKWYKKGQFKPYSDEELVGLLIKIKQVLPEWVRVNRLGRDIPVANIAAGTKLSNIRQVVQRKMKKRGLKCQCIRCREIRGKIKLKVKSLKLKVREYSASDGREFFLQYLDQENNLYALLRLRIPSEKIIFNVLKNSTIVRELHTYGSAVPIRKKAEVEAQHRGLGKKLIKKAEEITKKVGLKKIAVISGVGVRDYYRKLGYKLRDSYMIKYL